MLFLCVCVRNVGKGQLGKKLSIDLLFAYLGRIPSEIFLRL